MQKQRQGFYENYLPFIYYSHFQSLQLDPSPPQIYPIMYDFSGYNFKFFQLEDKHPYENLEAPAQKEHIQQNCVSEQVPEKQNNEEEDDSKDKDRNIVSNSLKVFRKYAADSSKAEHSIIEAIIAKNCGNYSVEEFGKDLDKKIPREKNYFGIKFLKTLVSSGKEKKTNFTIVIRTLLQYYYKKEIYPTVLTSWKILSQAKKKQIMGTRKILALLNGP